MTETARLKVSVLGTRNLDLGYELSVMELAASGFNFYLLSHGVVPAGPPGLDRPGP
jgi:hypothetical protein